MSRFNLTVLVTSTVALAMSACAGSATPSPEFPIGKFAAWSWDEPSYALYPGDRIAIDVLDAPELSYEAIVDPKGRIPGPLDNEILVAGRSVEDVGKASATLLSTELRDPRTRARLLEPGSQVVFVGGEVARPGVYDLPGDIGALEAVLLAGGFETTARRDAVVIVRRGAGGQAMLRVSDLAAGLRSGGEAEAGPLQRFDVVYVPRSSIAEVNLFIEQYVRRALPFEFGRFYDLSGE